MVSTRDYYSILGLQAPTQPSAADLRRAYKLALLAAHPDKKKTTTTAATGKLAAHPLKKTTTTTGTGKARVYTVDEVKDAYAVLSDAKRKAEYDAWIQMYPGRVQRGKGWGGGLAAPSSDFVLGLEVVDLSEFDVLDPGFEFSDATGTMANSNANSNTVAGDGEGVGQMEWTRACRCGADKGFRILEEELEDAESRGEKEVLVGCEGCSLWVRVGFEVEEG